MTDVTRDRDVVPPHHRRDRAAEPLFRELAGAVLRDARQRAGLRLVDVARRAGVSPQYLSEIERGVKDPSSEMLAAVAAALGLSLDELLTTAARRMAGTAAVPVELSPAISRTLVAVPTDPVIRPATLDPLCQAA